MGAGAVQKIYLISGNAKSLKKDRIPPMKISITEKFDLYLFADTALFNLGFRPFFLGAATYAIIAMFVWWLQYSGFVQADHLTPAWHAHEMIFGYTFAVIAGFLLTSVRNWTGIDTVSGGRLCILFSCWVLARLGNIFGSYEFAALLDLVCMVMCTWYIVVPIVQVKQRRQIAVVGIVSVLLLANGLYYSGQLGLVGNGIFLGNYLGLYLVLGLVLMMSGRVVPFFTTRGVEESVEIPTYLLLEATNFITYAVFALAILVGQEIGLAVELVNGLAGCLFILNLLRLGSWYTKGIWQKPLLWSLFLSYGFITLGFGLYALAYFGWFSVFIPIHALVVGGVSLLTLSMMARVSLGHTGRSIHEPSQWVVFAFGILAIAAITRVIMPILLPQYYPLLIQVSQILWMISFALFLVVYVPVLALPRVDSQPG
ncbi:MAG: hypothetical protein CMQ19_06795 [Gammaproteobacteria bacterium]|nr:hypothetical protein [Gammaproteobacteria bacterium]